MQKLFHRLLDLIQEPKRIKALHAFRYWKDRKAKEGVLSNSHYEYFYTNYFGFSRTFYDGKRVLDIGCGPRGSLEWDDTAAERVGLDPLAHEYRRLGTVKQKMRYVAARAEEIPFCDGYFDVVCCFNSLDHVDDLDKTVSEIIRITCLGGTFLLITEIHVKPTIREPQVFSWDVVEMFSPSLKVYDVRQYEKCANGIYQSVREGIPYNNADKLARYGVLSARVVKVE